MQYGVSSVCSRVEHILLTPIHVKNTVLHTQLSP